MKIAPNRTKMTKSEKEQKRQISTDNIAVWIQINAVNSIKMISGRVVGHKREKEWKMPRGYQTPKRMAIFESSRHQNDKEVVDDPNQ